MLREFTERDLENYADKAYALSRDPEKSCYPTYADGIKTKDDFVKAMRDRMTRENETALVFEYEGRAEGFIGFFRVPRDGYLQLDLFSVNRETERAMRELLARIDEMYPEHGLCFGFPAGNARAIACHEENGFERAESSVHFVLEPKGIREKAPDSHIVPVTRENYALFRALHTQTEDEMYWTRERIYGAIDDWRIYAYMRGAQAFAAIYAARSGKDGMEIFGIDFADDERDGDVCAALAERMISDCRADGIRYIVWFAGREEESAAESCGMRRVGGYVLYTRAAGK